MKCVVTHITHELTGADRTMGEPSAIRPGDPARTCAMVVMVDAAVVDVLSKSGSKFLGLARV